MKLKAETGASNAKLQEAVIATLRTVAKLGGTVEWVPPQSLPNDGKLISDER